MQHVQVPNDMTKESSLTPDCLLVYACIKRYMNKDTREAFPSLVTLCNDSGASEPTIRKCIKSLIDAEYLSCRKDGRKNVYTFSRYKNFEPFSYEFLSSPDYSFNEKAMLLARQQYMFKDPITHEGKSCHSDRQLSKLINMSHQTISKCSKSLEEKGIMRSVPTNVIDPETGCKITERVFDLDKLHQGIIFTLMNHESRISSNEDKLEMLAKEVASIKKDYDLVKRENQLLKEENKKLRGDEVINIIL